MHFLRNFFLQISTYSIITAVTYFIKCEQCWWRICISRRATTIVAFFIKYTINKVNVFVSIMMKTVYMQRQFLLLGEKGLKGKLES